MIWAAWPRAWVVSCLLNTLGSDKQGPRGQYMEIISRNRGATGHASQNQAECQPLMCAHVVCAAFAMAKPLIAPWASFDATVTVDAKDDPGCQAEPPISRLRSGSSATSFKPRGAPALRSMC